jgi:hypothetical protein
MRQLVLAFGLAAAMALPALAEGGHARREGLRRTGVSPEVAVPQATGRVRAEPHAKSALPELGTAPAGGAAAAPSGPAPTTCNAENATSPACYSATQQARPVTR